MAALELLPGAVQDIYRLDEFLRDKSPQAANKVSALLDQALVRLQRFPKLGRGMASHAPYRELAIPFAAGAYVIRYRLTGTRILVVRVWHSRETRE